jgi:ABC-type molybdate transport system permease subunit
MGLRELTRVKAAGGSTLLLISDGHANSGEQDPKFFQEVSTKSATEKVTTSTIGLGTGYDETILEALAQGGGGAHRFAGTIDEAVGAIAAEVDDLLDKTIVNAVLRITPTQAMSGVPSIVAGLFILSAVLYPITKGFSALMGALALAILMIPTVARTSEEVLLLIPNDLREAGTALGGTQWRTVAMIVLPAARSGLMTAVILGVARIAGETAPILLLTGGGDKVNPNPFDGSVGSLPYYIWKAFNAGSPEAITRAWAGLLVLMILVLILFVTARALSTRKISK